MSHIHPRTFWNESLHPSPFTTYQHRRNMRKRMRPIETPEETVLSPMMPPFEGFPSCVGPLRWTKPQARGLIECGMSAVFHHSQWLDARALDGIPHTYPLPERGRKMRARIRRALDETSTCDSETFMPDDIPDISDIEPFNPRD